MDTMTHTAPEETKLCRETDENSQEADLHGHYNLCDAHNQHFTPVHQLCVDQLPSGYQSAHLVNYVKAYANLVVSVLVNYVSEKRPENSPGNNKLYPCHNMRGRNVTREGTGFISGIYRFPDEHNPEFLSCECAECLGSSTPKTKFAHIAIRTATHLVFDNEEARKTICKIFFDEGDGIELSGMWGVVAGVQCDWCSMIYVTHDMDLVNMIEKYVTRSDHLKDVLVTNCLLFTPGEKKEENNENTLQGKLNITVSHSNQRDKLVSIVQCEHINETEAHSHGHISASVACPGSCGAPLLAIEKDWRLSGFEHTHSGKFEQTHESQRQENYSGHGIGFTPFNHKHTHTDDKNNLDNRNYENRTTEECWSPEVKEGHEGHEGHEVNLQNDVTCTRNPDHHNFIPVPDFKMSDLPPGFQKRNVMDCIMAVSALTVLVSVYCTSESRPETFPFSDTPYTGNKYKGTKSKRTGTGLVHDIVRYPNENSNGNETCPCKECLRSSTPKTHFAYVTIHSAAHVVFNDQEGEHTTCHLSFDEGGTPALCPGVMELKGASRVWCDINKDTSKIIFVTHDVPLIDKLCEKVCHWQCLQQKLEHRHIISSSKDDNASSGDKHGMDSQHGLTIIVSHPHGCSKQVSIGNCISMNATGSGYTECNYTTPTCPGSSGAYILVEGKFWKCWNKHHYGI